MKQYETWWAKLGDEGGTRPVVLLSRDAAYRILTSVLVVEVTTHVRGIPQEIQLGPREGLRQRSVASLDNIRRLPKSLLATRLGRIPSWRVIEVKRALGHALGWIELANL